jgi:Tol biopolymer transport system component
MDSDLAIYLPVSNTVISTSAISDPSRLETWPTWSPDGRYLYFCSAPTLWTDREKVPPERYRDVRYDLMRVGYEISSNTWGPLETVLSAAKTGWSITQPRISPDGRFLVFCMSEYSTFPSFQPSSDLYLMELGSGRYERMACNSDRSESWHSWSSNSRWLVFSSKRDDGQSIRAYFSYIDANGVAHKPFVLPQEDPAFYDSFVDLCQLPELIRERLPVRGEGIAEVIRSGKWEKVDLAVTSASPRTAPRAPAPPGTAPPGPAGEPWQPRH